MRNHDYGNAGLDFFRDQPPGLLLKFVIPGYEGFINQ